MKKIITIFVAILLVICSLCTFVACDPNTFYFDYDELKENVIRVELIYYDNPNAKKLFEQRDKVLPFDFDKMEIVEILSENEMDNFLHDLSEHPFMTDWIHSDSPIGYSIRIVYLNGDFEVISYYSENDYKWYSGGFYADGQVKRFIGTGLDEELFNKYFETKVK